MVSALEILHKIACSLYGYTDQDPLSAVDELVARHRHDCYMTITDDVEASEFLFLSRYGPGDTFYFTIRDDEEGKAIVADIQALFSGILPGKSFAAGRRFATGALLYLFIQIGHKKDRHPLAYVDAAALN